MYLRNRKKQGFTLVEVLVVVVVLVVLAGITTVVSIGIQQDSRDKTRKASATVVAESLEKYFKDNNEYPPVTAIASPTGLPIGDVKTKLGIVSNDTLVFPLAQDTTKASIVTGAPSTKQMQYTGNCTVDACNDFTLSYVEEKTGNTVAIKSRSVVSETPDPTDYNGLTAPTAPNVSGTLASNNTTVTMTASGATCKMGDPYVQIRYANSASALASTAWPTNWVAGSTSISTSTYGRNVTYHFQARARCVQNNVPSGVTLSSTGSQFVPPAPTIPNAPTVTAPGVGGGTWTWTTPTCNAGTVNFQFNSIKSGDGAWATSYTTGTSAWYGPASEEGSDYVVIVRAQCVNGSEQSGWSGDGVASVSVPVTSYTVVNNGYSSLYASGNAIYGLSQVYSSTPGCPVGTAVVYFQQIDLNDPDDGSQAAGPSGRNRIHSGWGAGSVAYYLADLDGNNANATLNDKLEFMWYTRCQNVYTGRYGPQKYSDIFGNARVVENRNVSNGKNGRWDRTCVGGSVDWPASDVVCGAGGPWGF